ASHSDNSCRASTSASQRASSLSVLGRRRRPRNALARPGSTRWTSKPRFSCTTTKSIRSAIGQATTSRRYSSAPRADRRDGVSERSISFTLEDFASAFKEAGLDANSLTDYEWRKFEDAFLAGTHWD